MINHIYVTITMPRGFRRLLDRYAKKHYQKRSEFIRSAVLKYIEFLERPKDGLDEK